MTGRQSVEQGVALAIEAHQRGWLDEQALSLVKALKKELPVGKPSGQANPSAADFNYDAMEQWYTRNPEYKK